MSNFFIRTWKDLTDEDGDILTINRASSFEEKPHPENKNLPKPKLKVGDTAYVYHTFKKRDDNHIPGNGLYCSGTVTQATDNAIKLKVKTRIGKIPFNNSDPKYKEARVKREDPLCVYIIKNCHEGYNILSDQIAKFLDSYLVS